MVYDKPVALLSDRAGNMAIKSDSQFSLEFHASAHMLITLYIWPLKTVPETVRSAPPQTINLEAVRALIEKCPELMPASGITPEGFGEMIEAYLPSHDLGFEIRAEQNIQVFVEAYNRRTVAQCEELVYGLAPQFPGITVVGA
jgi:hypothetical protein